MQQPNSPIYCAPCSAEIVQSVNEQEKEGIPEQEMEIPNANVAWTWSYSVINGIPVPVPICLRHMREYAKGTSSLIH